jgi:hypothetical protein
MKGCKSVKPSFPKTNRTPFFGSKMVQEWLYLPESFSRQKGCAVQPVKEQMEEMKMILLTS